MGLNSSLSMADEIIGQATSTRDMLMNQRSVPLKHSVCRDEGLKIQSQVWILTILGLGHFYQQRPSVCASRGRAILNARHSWYLITTITPCRYLGWSFHILPLIHGFSSACRSVECAWFYFKLVRSTWEDPLCLNYTELDSPLLQFDTIYASLSRDGFHPESSTGFMVLPGGVLTPWKRVAALHALSPDQFCDAWIHFVPCALFICLTSWRYHFAFSWQFALGILTLTLGQMDLLTPFVLSSKRLC